MAAAAIKARITSKGQITIPKAIRERLGVGTGDELEFVEERGKLVVRKRVAKSPFDRYVGYLAGKRGQDSDALVRRMRGHE